MIKNECDIVKDLLPNYIEGILSDNSKEFVDKHIKTCKYCKDTLDMLKNGEKIEEARKQKIWQRLITLRNITER